MNAKEDNLEYLSGEVQEILSTPPSWVTTWGTAVLVGVVALLALVGFFFEYPETVTGEVVLSTQDPPVLLHTKKAASLAEVVVGENQLVKKGDLLAVFSSSAASKDVLSLEAQLDSISSFDFERLKAFRPNPRLRLGELENPYLNFVNTLEELPFSVASSADQNRLGNLSDLNWQLNSNIQKLKAQKLRENAATEALKKANDAAVERYKLTTDTTIAIMVYDTYQKLVQKQGEIGNLDIEMANLQERIKENNLRIFEAQYQNEAGIQEKLLQLKQTMGTLRTSLQEWKNEYLVLSPIDGNVLFFQEMRPGQPFAAGEELFAVAPEGTDSRYVGKVRIPIGGSGKVRMGQDVIIKFDRYPFREFGTVKGKIGKIYTVAKGDAYAADVELDTGLRTSLGKDLDFYHQMGGKADIITDNQRFIARLFDRFLDFWD